MTSKELIEALASCLTDATQCLMFFPIAPGDNGIPALILKCKSVLELAEQQTYPNPDLTIEQISETLLEVQKITQECATALKLAIEIIRSWHGGYFAVDIEPVVWNAYYEHGPEMKPIRQALEKAHGLSPIADAVFQDITKAHVIASAAPELLAACRIVKHFLDTLEANTDDKDPLKEIRRKVHAPLREALEPAIAKAEGK